MASVIEDAETYQHSSISPFESNSDTVPLTNPTSDASNIRSTSMGNITQGTSIVGTIFLLINAALGAGLLNFPKAFNEAGGIEIAIGIQLVLLFFVIASLLILAKCSNSSHCQTVQATLSSSAGKLGQHSASFCVALYSYGTCITFLIVIGDQFDRALASLHGPDFCQYWYMDRQFLITAFSVIFILPLCFSLRIDFLKYVSSVGVLSIVFVVALIVYEYFQGNYNPGAIKTHPDNWTDVFLVVPVICFGYQCHVSAIPIYSCMRERNMKRFSVVVLAAMTVCLATYTLAGVFGYLTFGSSVPSDILEGYDATKPHVLIAIVALAVKCGSTYPILAFCGREALMSIFEESSYTSHPQWETWRRNVIIFIWFSSSVVLAIFIPDIGQIIKILGSLAAVFIFIFPGICLLCTTLKRDPSMVRKKNIFFLLTSCFMIVLGVFLFGLVLTQALQSDILSHHLDELSQSLCNITKFTTIDIFNA